MKLLSKDKQREEPILSLQAVSHTLKGMENVANELSKPNENDHLKAIREAIKFETTDPSKTYKATKKIGEGGMGLVFLVKRLSD